MKDNIKMKLPRSWNEVRLGMLEDMKGSNDPIKALSILSGLDEKDIRDMPVQFIDKAFWDHMFFLDTMPEFKETNMIKWKGDTYLIDYENKMTFGEYIAIQSILEANPHDYSGFLAVICRKKGEEYSTEYENTVYQQRKEMFRSMPVPKVMPLVAFFLVLWNEQRNTERVFSDGKKAVLDAIDGILEGSRSSREGGDGRRSLTRWQAMRLRRLRRFVESM